MRIVAFLLFPTAAAAFSAGPTATTTATLSSAAVGRIHKPPRGLGKTTTTKFGNQYKKSSSSYSLFHRRLQSSMQDGDSDGLKKRLQLFPLVALVVREWFLLWKNWWMKLIVNNKILPQIIQKKMKRITAAFLVAATIWIQGIPSLSGGFGTTPDAAHAATMSSTTTAVEQVEPYYNPFSFSSSSWEMEEDRLLLPAKFASTTTTTSSSGPSTAVVAASAAAASSVATTTTTVASTSTTSAAGSSAGITKATATGAAVLLIPIGATVAYLKDKKKKKQQMQEQQQQQQQEQQQPDKQEEQTDAPTRTISTTPTASPPTTTTLTSTATGEEKKKYTVVKAKRLTTTSDKNKTNENDDDDATNILKDEILPSQYVFLTVSNALVVACMVPHL